MTADRPRQTFELIPRGPNVSPNVADLRAGNGGELVGALGDDGVCTWLAQPGGRLVLMTWPRGFRARYRALEA